MHFLPQQLDDYIVAHSEDEPELLQQLTRETYQKILQPIMLSGAYQGRILSMISKLAHPKTILELGTFTGYATLCLAEGLQDSGVIHTIDINEELVDFQRKYFDASKYEVENTSDEEIEVAVSGNIRNFVGKDGSKFRSDWKGDFIPDGANKNINSFKSNAVVSGICMTSDGVDPNDPAWGTIALTTPDRDKVTYRRSSTRNDWESMVTQWVGS